MKNPIFYSLILFGLLFSTTKLKAYTTSSQFALKKGNVAPELPLIIQSGLNPIDAFKYPSYTFKELKATTAESSSNTQSKLNILYSLCFALVLINLMAQIKIIIQMIRLFFLFRKKEESVRLNF